MEKKTKKEIETCRMIRKAKMSKKCYRIDKKTGEKNILKC